MKEPTLVVSWAFCYSEPLMDAVKDLKTEKLTVYKMVVRRVYWTVGAWAV